MLLDLDVTSRFASLLLDLSLVTCPFFTVEPGLASLPVDLDLCLLFKDLDLLLLPDLESRLLPLDLDLSLVFDLERCLVRDLGSSLLFDREYLCLFLGLDRSGLLDLECCFLVLNRLSLLCDRDLRLLSLLFDRDICFIFLELKFLSRLLDLICEDFTLSGVLEELEDELELLELLL